MVVQYKMMMIVVVVVVVVVARMNYDTLSYCSTITTPSPLLLLLLSPPLPQPYRHLWW